MAFYKELNPKKMTRKDHLRSDSNWEEEGTRYRRSATKADEQRRENTADKSSKPYGNKPYGNKPAFKNEKNGYSSFAPKGKNDFRRDDKPKAEKPAPKAAPRTEKPAPRPAPIQHEDAFLPPENLLSGRNPIREAIKSGRDIEKLLVAKGDLSGTAREIVSMARDRHIPVQVVERTRLDEITRNHQGMLAFASAYRYYDVEDMLEEAKEKGEDPFLVVLDGVTDPQNLGAIIRTAACVGAHGVIVPERRAVGLTPSAVKASAGAVETVKVARVTNLTRTLEMLKQQNIWLYAADMVGDDYRKVDFSGPMALIVGAEGEGVSRLVLDTCDHRVSLPMKGGVGSLNASVAAGVLLYAAFSCRK